MAYQSYISGQRWNTAVEDGAVSGTPDGGRPLRAVSIVLEDQNRDGGIRYRSFLKGSGWQSFVQDSDSTGRQNIDVRMTALSIELTGDISRVYDVAYGVYLHGSGWSSWTMDGQSAGNTGSSSYIEAVQVQLVLYVNADGATGVQCSISFDGSVVDSVSVAGANGWTVLSAYPTFMSADMTGGGAALAGNVAVAVISAHISSSAPGGAAGSVTASGIICGDPNGGSIDCGFGPDDSRCKV